jgi:2-polyprenyl-3-methyl-5-hydroxy-6-metoxy-1,4-benzoquinol methylase
MSDTYPDSAIEIHPKVREIVNSLPKIKKGGKVLDAAAGNGYMSEWLLSQGFNVKALDICTDNWKVAGVTCEYSDFNKGIEARDNAFDLAISIETIEHPENPFKFIREIPRVLKGDGIVIVTTPNVHSIRAQDKYLFRALPFFV